MDSFGRLKDRQVDDMVGCDHFIQHFKQVAQQKAAKVNNSNSMAASSILSHFYSLVCVREVMRECVQKY